MTTAMAAMAAMADQTAGAQWIECHPIMECPMCGGTRTERIEGAFWDSCVNCGCWADEFISVVPVVLGAPPSAAIM